VSLRASAVSLDVADLAVMGAFWSAVLEAEPLEDGEDGISLPLAPGVTLDLLPVPEPKTVKDRLHLDLSPTDRDQDAELARLLALGAVRTDVGQGPDVTWVVLSDPEGNEFCLLRTRREPVQPTG
jgi:catechol-2,3-dioxygenase